MLDTNSKKNFFSSTGWVQQNPSGDQIQLAGCQPVTLHMGRNEQQGSEGQRIEPRGWRWAGLGENPGSTTYLLPSFGEASYLSPLGLVFLICIMG